jgi:hypothetical protein
MPWGSQTIISAPRPGVGNHVDQSSLVLNARGLNAWGGRHGIKTVQAQVDICLSHCHSWTF